jgi:hypothetical protein
MKENLHNQPQGRKVIAEGGAGDDVGKKINEKSTGHDNGLTQKKEKSKEFWAAPGLSKLHEMYR